ncbi:unnamed protein product [Somion occarium]|uniref:C2H2-type domain-containing protein n=1 Tax=Somion occarium TaxID=3059160 RepID=A0ABP1DTR5_9APHY
MLESIPDVSDNIFEVDTQVGTTNKSSPLCPGRDRLVAVCSRNNNRQVQVCPEHFEYDSVFANFVNALPVDMVCKFESILIRTILRQCDSNVHVLTLDNGDEVPIINNRNFTSYIHTNHYAAILRDDSSLIIWAPTLPIVGEQYRKLVSLLLPYAERLWRDSERRHHIGRSTGVTSLSASTHLHLSRLQGRSLDTILDHRKDISSDLPPLPGLPFLQTIEEFDAWDHDFVSTVFDKYNSGEYNMASLFPEECMTLWLRDMKLLPSDSPQGPFSSLTSFPSPLSSTYSDPSSSESQYSLSLSDITPPNEWWTMEIQSDTSCSPSSPSSPIEPVISAASPQKAECIPLPFKSPSSKPAPARRSSRAPVPVVRPVAKPAAPARRSSKATSPRTTRAPRTAAPKSAVRKIAPLPSRSRQSKSPAASSTAATPAFAALRLASTPPPARTKTVSPACSPCTSSSSLASSSPAGVASRLRSKSPGSDITLVDNDVVMEEEKHSCCDHEDEDADYVNDALVDDDEDGDYIEHDYEEKKSKKKSGQKSKARGAAAKAGTKRGRQPEGAASPSKKLRTKLLLEMSADELQALYLLERNEIGRFPCGWGCHMKGDNTVINTFARKADSVRHMDSADVCPLRPPHAPPAKVFPCPVCDKTFARGDACRRHLKAVHPRLAARFLYKIRP